MGAARGRGFLQRKGQVKLGNAAADDMDKGKENGQWWIKNKLNTASTHCDVSDQHKGVSCPSSKQKLAQVFATKPSTFSPSLCFASFLVRSLSEFWVWGKLTVYIFPSLCTNPTSLDHQLPLGPHAISNNIGTNQKLFPQLPGSVLARDGHSKAAWSDGAQGLPCLYLPCWPCTGHQLGKPGVLGQGLAGAGSYESSTHQS